MTKVVRMWAAGDEAKAVTEALFEKPSAQSIWLWTGGDIEHHVGLTDAKKDITTWVRLQQRLGEAPYRDVLADSATLEAFVNWLSPSDAAV